MSNPHPWRNGDHLIKCDVCARTVYRSEAKYRWDGILACTKFNCWDPKHAIFEVPPVINDPQPLLDTRPDQVSGTETYIDSISGLVSTFQGPQLGRGTSNGRMTFDTYHEILGEVDSPPDYTSR
jgi:hypothetical protein